jgi:two-component system, NarL family, response regulator NreC
MSENGNSPRHEPKVRVMLCHNFPVARIGLRTIIEAERDMEVVGEADNIERALELFEVLKPDVILTDLCGGRLEGLDAIRAVKNLAPQVKVLIRAYQRNGEYFTLAMRAGADGYFTRDAGPGEVANAIRTVNAGQNYLDLSTVTQLVTSFVGGNGKGSLDHQYGGVTEREREILCLVATDHTNSEIADVLHLSKQTVHNIRARLMEKLGFHDRLQLVKYAIRRRIVDVEEV